MTLCLALSDRMPDVALDRSRWTEDEERHLAGCADCRAEWAIVWAASRLGPPVPVAAAPEDIAGRAIARVSVERSRSRARRRLAVAAGLAAAATVAVAVWTGQGGPAPGSRGRDAPEVREPVAAAPSAPATGRAPAARGAGAPVAARLELAMPELDSLPEEALDSILRALDEPLAQSGSDDGQLGDGGDVELERALAGLEG